MRELRNPSFQGQCCTKLIGICQLPAPARASSLPHSQHSRGSISNDEPRMQRNTDSTERRQAVQTDRHRHQWYRHEQSGVGAWQRQAHLACGGYNSYNSTCTCKRARAHRHDTQGLWYTGRLARRAQRPPTHAVAWRGPWAPLPQLARRKCSGTRRLAGGAKLVRQYGRGLMPRSVHDPGAGRGGFRAPPARRPPAPRSHPPAGGTS